MANPRCEICGTETVKFENPTRYLCPKPERHKNVKPKNTNMKRPGPRKKK